MKSPIATRTYRVPGRRVKIDNFMIPFLSLPCSHGEGEQPGAFSLRKSTETLHEGLIAGHSPTVESFKGRKGLFHFRRIRVTPYAGAHERRDGGPELLLRRPPFNVMYQYRHHNLCRKGTVE